SSSSRLSAPVAWPPRPSASARNHAGSSADDGCEPRSPVLCWLGIVRVAGIDVRGADAAAVRARIAGATGSLHFCGHVGMHPVFGPRLSFVRELLADVLVVERAERAGAVSPPLRAIGVPVWR